MLFSEKDTGRRYMDRISYPVHYGLPFFACPIFVHPCPGLLLWSGRVILPKQALEPVGVNYGLPIIGGKGLSGQNTTSYAGKATGGLDFGSVSKGTHPGSSSHLNSMLPPKGKTGSKSMDVGTEDAMLGAKGLDELNFDLPLIEDAIIGSKNDNSGPFGCEATVGALGDAFQVADGETNAVGAAAVDGF
ncbi:hypothetical protein E3N88_02805 [Mikania micrantha]|uniref:Uncharacterized protein n=1 Tax=Mikania micrantha TaxID=192012 RepID=A0A5N6Q4Z1_9ASTR|nr:hypothetical protein E3N88_02805 [Mikania micrantha]